MRFATFDDKALIEEIVNDPRLRLWTAFDGAPPCDAAKYLTAPSFTLVDERGCFLALCVDPGRYVIHTNLLPHCRGADAVQACHDALREAFVRTDATELLTMVPATVPHAKLLARRMGFRHLFDRRAIWPVAGERHDIGFYALSINDWIMSGVFRQSGEGFHDRLHRELMEASHPSDPVHDAFVGAAVEMILASNLGKAIDTYNRWARFALYEPIRVASVDPLRIDIKQCVLRIEDGTFYVEANHA